MHLAHRFGFVLETLCPACFVFFGAGGVISTETQNQDEHFIRKLCLCLLQDPCVWYLASCCADTFSLPSDSETQPAHPKFSSAVLRSLESPTRISHKVWACCTKNSVELLSHGEGGGKCNKYRGNRKAGEYQIEKKKRKRKKGLNKHSWIHTWGPNRQTAVAFYNVFVGSLWLFSLTSPDLGMFISLHMTYSPTFLPAVSIADVHFRSDQTE